MKLGNMEVCYDYYVNEFFWSKEPEATRCRKYHEILFIVAGAIGNAVKRGYISVVGRQYCRSRNRKVNVFVREGEE